jgi:dual specificity phosphatase 12
MSIIEPTEFLPGVYVGDQLVASNPDFFRDKNIIKVVNCTNTLPCYFPNIEYFRIPVDDASDEVNNNIMAAHIIPAIKFILKETPSKNAGVLIHCHAGVSRSCTVATALLRYCCVPTLRHAVSILVEKRKIAFMNGRYINFQHALLQIFHH